MDAFIDHPHWFEYIETPQSRKAAPVKLDKILKARMRVFLAAKQAKN